MDPVVFAHGPQYAGIRRKIVSEMSDDRKKLPGIYESQYKSELLKKNIADDGMWFLIPCISGGMDSKE